MPCCQVVGVDFEHQEATFQEVHGDAVGEGLLQEQLQQATEGAQKRVHYDMLVAADGSCSR